VGAVGYSGGYFVHQRREIRGQRGSSKEGRMERACLRSRSCMSVSIVFMTGGHSSPVCRTYSQSGDCAGTAQGDRMAERERLLVSLSLMIFLHKLDSGAHASVIRVHKPARSRTPTTITRQGGRERCSSCVVTSLTGRRRRRCPDRARSRPH